MSFMTSQGANSFLTVFWPNFPKLSMKKIRGWTFALCGFQTDRLEKQTTTAKLMLYEMGPSIKLTKEIILVPFAAKVKVVAYFHWPLWNFIKLCLSFLPQNMHRSSPSSPPSTQQAPLQHENELNLILQLLPTSYSLGSQTVLLKPAVPSLIQNCL